MSQCWAVHAGSGARCDRKAGHEPKAHRFQWADAESAGFTTATTGIPVVGQAPPLALVPPGAGGGAPDATGVDNPTGLPALTEEDAALAQRPVSRIVTSCVVCQHDHAPGTACSAKTAEGMDCGCLNAIPSRS